MTGTTPRITCIGLANVDVIANVSDEFITRHHIAKGASTLFDSCSTGGILGLLDRPAFSPGGCMANTACGIAALGLPVRFVGKTGDDSYAEIFRQGFGLHPNLLFDTRPYSQKMTSTCITLVTPDKDRSFALCQDTAGWFVQPGDLPDLSDGQSHIVYMDSNLAAMKTGADGLSMAEEIVAKYADADVTIILNLTDREIVDDVKTVLLAMIKSGGIAYVIGNMQEVCTLLGVTDFDEAYAGIDALGRTFLVTDGANGVHIVQNGTRTHIPARDLPPSRIVNTLGAGDQFSAGTIAGLAQGMTIEQACAQGVEEAAQILQQLSPRPKRKKNVA